MEKDHMRNLVKNVDTQLFEIVNNLICSICQELFNKPVTTPCGHSFCNGCIKRVLSSKDNSGCPLCKNPVKRYGLQTDEVKSTLTRICQDLPSAFEKDVKALTNNLTVVEDLVKTSKLSQLYNQEFVKEPKTNKLKSTGKKKSKKTNEPTENDSGTFIPVLKRTKNVVEYASAKKKRMDDLVSISQTEVASISSFGDSSGPDKKLENIEKIPPDKKVSEWFNAVGDNIYINSPTSSLLGTENKTGLESDAGEEEKATMIRRDYNKTTVPTKSKADAITPTDPYEFVPSQNNNIIKRKRTRKSNGKKLPDFKALQSFSKESIKRNKILLDESKEEAGGEEASKDSTPQNQITASQKFDQLLSETKEEQKKSHVLYSASQASSTQFLDVSFHSKVEEYPKKKPGKMIQKKLLDDVLFKNTESSTEEKEGGRRSVILKRRRGSAENVKSDKKKKKLFTELIEMNKDEASQLEKSMEKYLIRNEKKLETPPTRLGELLKELLDDDIVYASRPTNAPVRLPELVPSVDPVAVTQNTQMIGFCSQEETTEVRNFKRMVEDMEKELNSTAYTLGDSKEKPEEKPIEKIIVREEEEGGENESADEESSKILEPPLVEFLHLGKLTPIRKRKKTSVVKLVFPIGLTSLARRRALEHGRNPEVTKKQTCHVSTGIQTSQQTVSAYMQTSQVPQSSVNMQTSQEERPSVEIQTTQKWTTSAEIQTSQTLVCQEIQTTQIGYESAQVQTTQMEAETPIRKPSREHRKIIKPESPKEPKTPTKMSNPQPPPEVIMDFEIEEFGESWRKTQNHDQLVEFKNKKNKEQNEKLRRKSDDEGSDDSDVQPRKKRTSLRIFSQDSTPGILEDFETRQKIPLDVRKVNRDEDMEIIDLETPKTQNSEEQMLRVLKNIDLDLPRSKNVLARGEKSEESDSDFFVEQTPPRPTQRTIEDMKNLSKSRTVLGPSQKQPEIQKENSEGTDLIGDSIPKGFSESFHLTAPQRIPLTPEKKEENHRKSPKIDFPPTIDLPNENDQNQLNAFDPRPNSRIDQSKPLSNCRKPTAASPPIKTPPQKRIRVVASSVKNPDLIKKFVNRFKIEYLNKPTKDMTHLIVGLHDNDDNEFLPLCTPKLLFAMANRKWVVSEYWAECCLKKNSILPEESFETLDPVGGAGCRVARLSTELLLRNCEICLLGEFQMISKEEFAELILDCGGSLLSGPDKFSFLPSKIRLIIADRDCVNLSEKQLHDLYQKHSTVVVSRDVIIMSVQSYRMVNFFPYLMHPASEERLVTLGYPRHLVRHEEEEEEEDGEGEGEGGSGDKFLNLGKA